MSLFPLFTTLRTTCPATEGRGPCLMGPFCLGFLRPMHTQGRLARGIPIIEDTEDTFKVHFNMQQFSPLEVKVRLVGQDVVIEGKSERSQEDTDMLQQQQFMYRYRMPQSADLMGLTSHFTSDGILTLSAPKQLVQEIASREIEIILTNEPAVLPADAQEVSLEPSADNSTQPADDGTKDREQPQAT